MTRNCETLWYQAPAKDYSHAIPLGNGRLGAMVQGGIGCERIHLNEDTLWSGFPRANGIDNAYERYTKRIRERILKKDDLYGAEDLADRLQGAYNESYLSAGELILQLAHGEEVEHYCRGLDLRRGVAFVEYQIDGVQYRRELLCSAADDVIVLRLTADRAGALTLKGRLDSMIRHTAKGAEGWLSLCGRAPRHVEPQYLERGYGDPQAIVYDENWEDTKGLLWESILHVSAVGGTLSTDDCGFSVSQADECTVCLWLGTNFDPNRFEKDPSGWSYCIADADLETKGRRTITHALRDGWTGIYRRHVADMEGYFDRVSLSLAYDPALDALPTDVRKERYDAGKPDAGLEKLAFDFGRYLLYSSSREGTQAANLQGIWCWELRPKWSCNYTVNINTQMNYWGVEVLNMPECHLPLVTLIDELTHTGAQTAQSLYGARGFCVHHNVDLWRAACPIGRGESDCKWSLFPVGGIWLSLHVFEHYRFTRDQAFLQRYFHILKEAALFSVDMMCEMEGGYLGMCPTTVPERRFTRADGVTFAVGVGSTFDYELLSELYDAVRTAVADLNLQEEALLAALEETQKRFPPLPISKDGTLQFWQIETAAEEYLWVNTLFGVYPGHSLLQGSSDLQEAARKTMERYDVRTGTFANAWSAGVWARLKEGERAYELLRYHIGHAILDSLLGCNQNGGTGAAFQVDSNFGLIAAMAEMLVQSDGEEIRLLPALPDAWKTGSLRDFCTRCAVKVSLCWKDGRITALSLCSKEKQTVAVRLCDRGETVRVSMEANETVRII